MFKKGLAFFLFALIIYSVSASSFALGSSQAVESSDTNTMQYRWTKISKFDNSFDISSSGKATVEVILYASDVDKLKVKASLQQYKGGKWKTIKSWSNTSKDEYCAVEGTYYVTSGYSYRLVSTGTVYKNDPTQCVSCGFLARRVEI